MKVTTELIDEYYSRDENPTETTVIYLKLRLLAQISERLAELVSATRGEH